MNVDLIYRDWKRRLVFFLVLLGGLWTVGARVTISQMQHYQTFDVVLQNGRVIDPETGLDAVLNVGIRGDRIVEIAKQSLQGHEVIDVSGLIVSPGFIDLHAHGQTNKSNEFQVHDGVTTALEMEQGRSFVNAWLQSRTGKALLNFGATVGHGSLRWQAMKHYSELASRLESRIRNEGFSDAILAKFSRESRSANYKALESNDWAVIRDVLWNGLSEGALGVGVAVGYFPGATREEIFRVYEFAAKHGAPIFTHVREGGIEAIQEALANAAVTGAPLHIVHLNSMVLGKIGVALDMVASAQKRGLDVTTEVYPYTAASTWLESAIFDPGWQERLAISYGDLQWVATGERLTENSFSAYRALGGMVIIHMMRPEWIEQGVRSPITLIASDGMPFSPGAHPRSAGTFSRVLGRYVREEGTLSLMDALAKMTIRPARRLEAISPAMRLKGRLQVGSDADITVFDPTTIIDTATFENGLSFSDGVHHVLVNGTFVVRDGDTVAGTYPGRAVLGRYRTAPGPS